MVVELEAGSELDAMIAEKVLGLARVELACDATEGRFAVGLDSVLRQDADGTAQPWSPSTSIADAMEALPAAKPRDADVWSFHENTANDEWLAKLHTKDGVVDAVGQSLPHAICLACLAAVEQESPA